MARSTRLAVVAIVMAVGTVPVSALPATAATIAR
jgi:hypothetical protein